MNDPTTPHFGQQEILPDNNGLVTLRGFLYKTTNGSWVLSQEPNLKSCCVGAQSKVMKQIYLFGELPDVASSAVAEVTGRFKVEPHYSDKGTLTQYYTLEDVVIQHHEADYTILGWVGAGLVALLISVKLFQYWRWASRKT
jgi:hypothetical protein